MKPFLDIFFENFGKLNVKNFQGSSSLRWKMKKSKFFKFFCKKYYFFWLNLYCTCSQLSFEVYISCLAQNLKFWPFLVWKISFLTFVIWQLVAAKVYNWRGCFWCLWKAKDQNIYLRTSFGQKVACLVNLWSLKYGRDDLTPPHVRTSYQNPCRIGLNGQTDMSVKIMI